MSKSPDDKTKEIAEGQEVGRLVRKKTTDALYARGITLDLLALKLKQAINAKKVKAWYDKDLNEVVYSKNLTDNGTRLKATELAFNLLDSFPDKRHHVDHEASDSIMSMVAELINKPEPNDTEPESDGV